jgi:hypothetical protein
MNGILFYSKKKGKSTDSLLLIFPEGKSFCASFQRTFYDNLLLYKHTDIYTSVALSLK